jgi:hypothetical protein
MSIPDDAPSRELLEYGRRDLERRFDPELNLVRYQTDLGAWHDPRDSLWYALCLLLDGETQTAERILRRVTGMQERHQGDPHCGNFRWLFEDDGSLADFLVALEGTPLSDEVTGGCRRIGFGEKATGLMLEYDLRDMQPLTPVHRRHRVK